MRKQILTQALLALCGGALVLTACVDKDYDFGNLDTTVKIGDGSLMLPTSSTEDIQLNNLFSLTDDGAVMESADGFYYLHKGGSSTEQVIHLEDIAIPSPEITPFSATLDGQTPNAPASVKAFAPLTQSPDLWVYPFEEKTTLRYNEENSNLINADVIEVKSDHFW